MDKGMWQATIHRISRVVHNYVSKTPPPFLSIYPPKLKTLIQKSICTPVFTAALLTVANIWKQPKYPSTDQWIKKM